MGVHMCLLFKNNRMTDVLGFVVGYLIGNGINERCERRKFPIRIDVRGLFMKIQMDIGGRPDLKPLAEFCMRKDNTIMCSFEQYKTFIRKYPQFCEYKGLVTVFDTSLIEEIHRENELVTSQTPSSSSHPVSAQPSPLPSHSPELPCCC